MYEEMKEEGRHAQSVKQPFEAPRPQGPFRPQTTFYQHCQPREEETKKPVVKREVQEVKRGVQEVKRGEQMLIKSHKQFDSKLFQSNAELLFNAAKKSSTTKAAPPAEAEEKS